MTKFWAPYYKFQVTPLHSPLKQLNPHPALPSLSLTQCPLDSPSPILHKNSLQISPEIELYWLEKTGKKAKQKSFFTAE